jgi:predicted HicB family RNase H-like nuclease
MNTGKIAAMAKRGYSRDFTPQTNRRVRIEVDRVPPTLYDAVAAKAKREGISLRALVLKLLSEWVGRSAR